jgi:hypothetical protein
VENIHAQSNSDGVTLNIILHPIQTITINSSQKKVNLEYINREDYDNGVSATLDDHLSVTSTGGFQVNVASKQDNFTLSGSTELIPLSDVLINAVNGSDNTLVHTFDDVVLSSNPESLIRSGLGGRDLKYNITYDNTLGSSDKYINKNPNNKESVFTTEITYTITTK